MSTESNKTMMSSFQQSVTVEDRIRCQTCNEAGSTSILVLTPLPPLLAWRRSTAISTPETTGPA